MKTLMGTLTMLTTLAVQAGALPQETPRTPPPSETKEAQPSRPPDRAPDNPPPPPPTDPPKPPPPAPQSERQQSSGSGQWVYTEQYGWVWMPYGDRYTHVPPDGSPPNMYVYEPEVGWCWVVAPWLWGWGPMPYFGTLGYRHYAWFGVGLGRWHGFGGHYGYRSWVGPRYWYGGHWTSRGGLRGFGPGVRR